MNTALKGYSARCEDEFELAAWQARTIALLGHTDPKHIPSLEKMLGKVPAKTQQQSDAETASNAKAWLFVLRNQKGAANG